MPLWGKGSGYGASIQGLRCDPAGVMAEGVGKPTIRFPGPRIQGLAVLFMATMVAVTTT